MSLSAIFCLCLFSLAHVADAPLPPVRLANFGVGDTLFIVVIALIVFGPKKLPEISRQVGKLLYEFRKASNDFKFQIEEELRASEQAERQKELSAQAAASQPATPVAITAGETVSAEPATDEARAAEPAGSDTATAGSEVPKTPNSEIAAPETSTPDTSRTPTIQPPASGLPVSSRSPYRAVENTEGATEVTAAGQSLDEPQALDELQADAQDAMRAAAAEPSHSQTGDSVPTHHG
ncbi:MAG: sec-independent protein translocase protein TatB [Acidobacteriaceae bacterium]|jgi:sec-independent protein translocase protein TatB|nr:sec-independent protein translocase protein TatB [Acidobacteriaceae bacterium]